MAKNLSTQLIEAKEELATMSSERVDLLGRIEALEKEVQKQKEYKERYLEQKEESDFEVQQIHQILNYLPNPVPIRGEDEYRDRSIVVRFAAWLGQQSSK
jgi:ABC-type bacteriocin/lantibiotic exporter with double-glycine peptidase domain